MHLLNHPVFQSFSTMNAKMSVCPVYEYQNVSAVCLVTDRRSREGLHVIQYYE